MSTIRNSALGRLCQEESGQALPWMIFLMGLFLGAAGITVDLGHAYVCYRELQSSTDAAALAGAYAMSQAGATTASVTAAVDGSSSLSTGSNANANLPNVGVTPTFRCVSDSTIVQAPCSASPTGYNVLQVVQTSSVPTYFIRGLALFGIHAAGSIPLSTMATATPLSGKNTQVNVAMVVDTTNSMGQQDSDGQLRQHADLLRTAGRSNSAATAHALHRIEHEDQLRRIRPGEPVHLPQRGSE